MIRKILILGVVGIYIFFFLEMTGDVAQASGDQGLRIARQGFEFEHEGFRCGTCEYLAEQRDRIARGQKVQLDTRYVPEDFWIGPEGVSPMDAWRWPWQYYGVLAKRTDSNGNGLRECRFRIDFSKFHTEGGFSTNEVTELENEMRIGIQLWNDILKFVGLEFLEVDDDSHHIVFEAEGNVSRATFFGAFGFNGGIYHLSTSLAGKPLWEAGLQVLDNASPDNIINRPPGNPYVKVVDRQEFGRIYDPEIGGYWIKNPIINTIMHEIGHLLGLMHPFEAFYHVSQSNPDSYMVDWLSFNTVENSPPDTPSWIYSSEDFSANNWSRRFINTFMSYENPNNHIYPETPPPIKAFIAHYYGQYNLTGAQTLLNQAIQEHQEVSFLARGEIIQEIEPNNTMEQAMSMQIGQSVLGALSSRFENPGSSINYWHETWGDTQDWYKFYVNPVDAHRDISIKLSMGSYRDLRRPSVRLYDGGGNLIASHLFANRANTHKRFGEFDYTPASSGWHYIQYEEDLLGRDYLLSVEFADGMPPISDEPTPTPDFTPEPTPTATPTPTPTPIPSLLTEQCLDLRAGFQFVSLAVAPETANVRNIFDPALDGLDFVRNSAGANLQFAFGQWLNGIGNWNTNEGYLVKMDSPSTLCVSGVPVDLQTPIQLREGFQFIPFYPSAPMNALDAVAGILDDFEFMRDSDGNSLQFAFGQWLNGIGMMAPGQGYLVRMKNSAVLVFPDN